MTGPTKLVVLEADFNSITAQKAPQTSDPVYDLHDFSHMTVAALHSTLYGNKYQSSLHLLRKDHTRLITSPGK